MNGQFAPLIAPLLSKLDFLHLLQVLDGSDPPNPEEVKQIRLLHSLLSAPLGGDLVWSKLVPYLKDKGFAEIALAYLNQGLGRRVSDHTPVTEIEAAKEPFIQLLTAILEDPSIYTLGAITQCPACNFTYGVSK